MLTSSQSQLFSTLTLIRTGWTMRNAAGLICIHNLIKYQSKIIWKEKIVISFASSINKLDIGIPKSVENASIAVLQCTLLWMQLVFLRMRPHCESHSLLPSEQPYKLLHLLLLESKSSCFLFMAFPASRD